MSIQLDMFHEHLNTLILSISGYTVEGNYYLPVRDVIRYFCAYKYSRTDICVYYIQVHTYKFYFRVCGCSQQATNVVDS